MNTSLPLEVEAKKLFMEATQIKIELLNKILRDFPLRIEGAKKKIATLDFFPNAVEIRQKGQKKEIRELYKKNQELEQEAKKIETNFQNSKAEKEKMFEKIKKKVVEGTNKLQQIKKMD